MKRQLALIVLAAVFFVMKDLIAQTVAIYPVKTEGFRMNQSEVSEMHRIAMQSCYENGLTCSGRGQTTTAVQREQGFAGGGKVSGAAYVAECALIGKTVDRFNVGMKKGGLNVFGGVGRKIGKNAGAGVGSHFKTSGLRVGGDGMNLTCQFSRTADGVLVFSETDEKMGLSGELILIEAKQSNTKKVQTAFNKMFKKAKSHLGD